MNEQTNGSTYKRIVCCVCVCEWMLESAVLHAYKSELRANCHRACSSYTCLGTYSRSHTNNAHIFTPALTYFCICFGGRAHTLALSLGWLDSAAATCCAPHCLSKIILYCGVGVVPRLFNAWRAAMASWRWDLTVYHGGYVCMYVCFFCWRWWLFC